MDAHSKSDLWCEACADAGRDRSDRPKKVLIPAFVPETEQAATANSSTDTVGTFIWDPITFNGTDCHGRVQLTLYSNGGYNFNGSFTDPDVYDLDDSLAFVVLSSSGVLNTFTHSGSMHGWGLRWLEGGSDTDSWDNEGTNGAIQGGWADLCAGWRWQANAGVNFDLGTLLNEVEQIVSAVEKVITIVGVVTG